MDIQLSRVIDLLRYPMAVLVVMCHCGFLDGEEPPYRSSSAKPFRTLPCRCSCSEHRRSHYDPIEVHVKYPNC